MKTITLELPDNVYADLIRLAESTSKEIAESPYDYVELRMHLQNNLLSTALNAVDKTLVEAG